MPGNRDLKTEAKRLAARERRPKVLVYRMSGGSTRDIAAKLNVSHTTIRNDLNALYLEFAEKEADLTAELRALESQRLDKLQSAVWVQALTGHPDSVRTVLSIMERRARIFGLDRPVQLRALVETGVRSELDAALQRLGERLDEATFKRVLEALL